MERTAWRLTSYVRYAGGSHPSATPATSAFSVQIATDRLALDPDSSSAFPLEWIRAATIFEQFSPLPPAETWFAEIGP